MESIQVSIRIRPFLSFENPSNTTIIIDEKDDRKIRIGKSLNYFEAFYDKIFFPKSTQSDIFNFISPGIARAKRGINCTIMAYGQTGSGKTYTMFGSDWTLNSKDTDYLEKKEAIEYDKYNFIHNDLLATPFAEANGIVPRVLVKLFEKEENIKITCSYIQIYNEKIYDLLKEEDENVKEKFSTYMRNVTTEHPIKQKPLNIREDKVNGVYIDGVIEVDISNFYDCFKVLKEGERNRKKRQTYKNEMSSRSHTIFILNILSKIGENIYKSKINLCDLAGSEKYNKKKQYKQIHLKEMVNINLSLVSLGNVIHALVNSKDASNHRITHIPYRNTKLTYLLQDSLGGNTKTYIIATISPSDENFEESLSTLKFADRAHSVMTKLETNNFDGNNDYNNSDNITIKKLSSELSQLKQLLSIRTKRGTLDQFQMEMMKLKEENDQLKRYYMNNEPMQRLMKENLLLKEQIRRLKASKAVSDVNYRGNIGEEENEYMINGYIRKLNTPLSDGYSNNYSGGNVSNNSNMEGNSKLGEAGRLVIGGFNNYGDVKERENSDVPMGYKPKIVTKKNEDINKEIQRTNARLKMLDELERRNKMRTQKMIEEITNKNSNRRNDYLFNVEGL